MNCPVDETPMSGGVQGEMRYEACPACRGLWVSPATLASPAPPVFVLFKNLPGLETADDTREGQRRCGDCRTVLVARDLAGTTIDICPRCGGIWLGAGEFDRVAEWYRAHPRHEWPAVSPLETPSLPASGVRDASGLPRGIRAQVGKPFEGLSAPPVGESPADRMKRAIKLLGEIVDRNMTE